MEQKPFIIYKSSAGSGKTYTLTLEYLKLALQSPHAFKQILAVTFTNKATQEMKERIIGELKRLRNQVNPDEKMDSELIKSLQVDVATLKVLAQQTLTAILHDYGRFSVSTIDSFFQKVVRAFAREIDLNAKFDVELDQDAVLERVVDRVVMLVMEDEFLHNWLVDYAYEQIQNGKSWDIRRNIRSLGKQIFQEDFKKYSPEIKEFLKDKENITLLQSFVRERKNEIIGLSNALKQEANDIRIKNGLEWSDFNRGFIKILDKLGDPSNPFPELTPATLAKIDNPESWHTKSSKQIDAILSAYDQGLNQVLHQILALTPKWNTLQAIAKNSYVYGVFRNLLDELTLIKDEENILLISDANEFLKEITKGNDTPFIYEKVGNQYKNYLIDEFQDTSGFQWDSFKPLLENSLGNGQTNLLVGDVKQSIYRWRGGEMKLLLSQVEDEIGEESIQLENLDTNFRSLPNIINFNNAVFKALPKAMESVLTSSYGVENPQILSQAYSDCFQKISPRKAKSEFKGKVKLEFIDPKEAEDGCKFDEMVLEKLPGLVMELQDHGYHLQDIAFLVRNKAHGEAIADRLMAYAAEHPGSEYRFDVLSDESMFLDKAASVKALISGFNYLHNPADKVQFKTMWYYLAVLKEAPVDHELFALDQIPDYLQQQVLNFQEREMLMLQLPLMEALEELIKVLGLMELGLEKAYISGFKEAVYDFTANNRADLSSFLDWWEANKAKRTVKIPEGHNAMRILTIHKSKGLQFKVVVMPFLKWDIFDLRKDNVVWSPFEDKEKGVQAVIPLSLSKNLADSDFRETYAEEATMAYLDSLNLLYVSLTRAEDVFIGYIPYKEKIGSQNYIEVQLQLLIQSSSHSEEELSLASYYDPESKIFEYGEWPDKQVRILEPRQSPELRWAYKNWSQLLTLKKYAVDFSPEGMEQRKKQKFGLIVHEILELSVDKASALQNLQSFYFEGRLHEEEKQLVEKQLDQLFKDSLFASWFGAEGVLLAEQGILLPGGKQKRPDRIILNETEAVIVDFKTGEAQSRYANQVREYMELVSKLSQKPAKGYLCYLETGVIEEVYA
ncbi:UvrD-helicase domain-containing protein [Algoriphagus halophytocola]|uniref:DNA 3'-5' helicase n=1 Tax=Algoriphagus halophytocola TaxID=2991499 RepID=A0ABY6MK07_9BACT|nr:MULTISPECIES: UvrD-helicase domain-containing protein [unclassified Algoriphagus]UZD24111.1 UvrD-helicase domain-containing protein [Algoriphagus sp. TR-M5]WBL41482.1 UvrD-helicase domain-containing protein [Algoriphagus sp. TR-M9]